MIIEDINETNVTLTMSAVEAGVLLKFLSIVKRTNDLSLVSQLMKQIGIVVSNVNVLAHLEAIRVILDDYEEDIFTHLKPHREVEVGFDPYQNPTKPTIVH